MYNVRSTVLSHSQLNFIFTLLTLKLILGWLILAVHHSHSTSRTKKQTKKKIRWWRNTTSPNKCSCDKSQI